MNYFFGIKSSLVESQLTIPRFPNSKSTNHNYRLFRLRIVNKQWSIEFFTDVELNSDFYQFESSRIEKDDIFGLATRTEVMQYERTDRSRLLNLNSYTDTIPDFRANLQVSINGGGFSSYQSEYPFSMVTRTGSILSPISSLLDTAADQNIVFLRNIYELPINDEFEVLFVNLNTRRVIKREVALTNCLNELIIENDLIAPDVFLFTDRYLGVPIYCSITDRHISLEHTHSPHEYFMGDDEYGKSRVAELQRKFHEIIN